MPVEKTFCSICNPHRHCGINALVEGGHLMEVEGMPEHPANQGTLCAKGAASLQYVYAEIGRAFSDHPGQIDPSTRPDDEPFFFPVRVTF